MSLSKKINLSVFQIIGAVLLLVGGSLFVGAMFGNRAFVATDDKNQVTTTDQNEKPEAVMTVQAVSPTLQAMTQELNASGIIAGQEIAQVGARVSGVAITQVRAQAGDYVKAGQVLAVLDSQNAHEQTQMARAELEQAQASLEKAMADVARVTPLLEIDAISRQQYDAYKTAERQAQATVKSLTARLNSTITSESYAQVVAPVSGIIGEKFADVGMMTTGTPLFSIIKNGVLEWQASLPTAEATKIGIGQPAMLEVAGQPINAQVYKLSPIANNSRELTVHAVLEASPLLRSGMYQTGRFLLSSQQVPVLPYRVISHNDGMDYVWVLTKSEHDGLYQARRTLVQIQARQADKVAVDLPEDTLVVAEGGNFLSEGSFVKLASSSTTQ